MSALPPKALENTETCCAACTGPCATDCRASNMRCLRSASASALDARRSASSCCVGTSSSSELEPSGAAMPMGSTMTAATGCVGSTCRGTGVRLALAAFPPAFALATLLMRLARTVAASGFITEPIPPACMAAVLRCASSMSPPPNVGGAPSSYCPCPCAPCSLLEDTFRARSLSLAGVLLRPR